MYDRVVDVPRLMGSLPEGGPAPEVVADVQVVLRQRYGMEFDRIGLALYRDGRDSVAWHGDQVARELPQAYVATVSLGRERRIPTAARCVPAARPTARHAFGDGGEQRSIRERTCPA